MVVPPVPIIRQAHEERAHDVARPLGGLQRRFVVALQAQRERKLSKAQRFTAQEVGRNLARFDELPLQAARAIEYLARQIDRHALPIAQLLRHVQDERIGGLSRRRERALGPVALLLRKPLRRERCLPLPDGSAGEQQQTSRRRCGNRQSAPLLAQLL